MDADAIRGPRRPLHQAARQPQGIGEIFHITGDKGFAWNDIYHAIARGLGVEAKIVHVPTDTLVRYVSDWEGPLLGDKTWTALFDNSKVKRVAGEFLRGGPRGCPGGTNCVRPRSPREGQPEGGPARPADRSDREGTAVARNVGADRRRPTRRPGISASVGRGTATAPLRGASPPPFPPVCPGPVRSRRRAPNLLAHLSTSAFLLRPRRADLRSCSSCA